MIIIAFIIGIIVMVGLFSFFNTYPDPIYFETFGSREVKPVHERLGSRRGRHDAEPIVFLDEPGIF